MAVDWDDRELYDDRPTRAEVEADEAPPLRKCGFCGERVDATLDTCEACGALADEDVQVMVDDDPGPERCCDWPGGTGPWCKTHRVWMEHLAG